MIRGKYLRERKAMRVRRRFKVLVAITIILIIYKILSDSFSLYESQAISDANIDIAFFLVNDRYSVTKEDGSYEYTKRVNIADLKPGDSKDYTIWISNYAFFNEAGERSDFDKEGFSKVVADTNIEYKLTIRATTNLPLEYKFYTGDTEEEMVKSITQEKTDEIYFYNIFTTETKKLKFNDDGQQDTYKLEIKFPEEYKDAKYQDIIEYIEVSIDAKQIVKN